MTYKVKIESWNEQTGDLTVKFASSETGSTDPDAYDAVVVQPYIFKSTSEAKKELGRICKAHCATIVLKESSNEADDQVYASWVGQTFEFTEDDLSPDSVINLPPSNEVVL